MSKFLSTATVLLISSKPSHRSGVRKLLVDLGVENQRIEVAADFIQASERLKKAPINILITDDDIGDQGTAIDLVAVFEANNSSKHSRLLILMTGTATPDFRKKFLELGGDLIIDKPYTSATFITPFKNVVKNKCELSQDEKMALDVEEALNKNNREKALEMMGTAENLKSPAAYYSLGMISKFDQDYLKAYSHFAKSLEKKMDLKVLANLVDTGVKSKKYKELDMYVEKWIKKFPLKSESVPDITRVVLYNKKFNLLSEMNVEDQNGKVPLAAGYVVASIVFLDRGDKERSIEFAKKGIENSGLKPTILLKGIEVLIQAGAKAEALKIVENLKLKSSLGNDNVLKKNLDSLLGI
jgi:CheY-like chemotaxis protein